MTSTGTPMEAGSRRQRYPPASRASIRAQFWWRKQASGYAISFKTRPRPTPSKGSVAQKVGDYYASFMDEDGIEAKGLTPLADEMARISAITNKASLSAYLGATLNTEVDGLTANADHIFGVWVNQSFTDSDHYVFHLLQGGLGMPDRDDYLDPSPKMAELRAQYQAHIAAVLRLAGIADAETKAARILSLEIRIAQPTPQTPTPPTSSSRTTRGNVPTLTSKRRAWIGTLISSRPELPASRNSSFGSPRL